MSVVATLDQDAIG